MHVHMHRCTYMNRIGHPNVNIPSSARRVALKLGERVEFELQEDPVVYGPGARSGGRRFPREKWVKHGYFSWKPMETCGTPDRNEARNVIFLNDGQKIMRNC